LIHPGATRDQSGRKETITTDETSMVSIENSIERMKEAKRIHGSKRKKLKERKG
jgi:hypothetical protein